MRKLFVLGFIAVIAAGLIIAGCAKKKDIPLEPGEIEDATNTPVETATDTPVLSPTSTWTNTPNYSPTNTPNVTPTFTATVTEEVAGPLLDDCERPEGPGQSQNLWGGYWFTFDDLADPNNGDSYVVPWTEEYAESIGEDPVEFYMQQPGADSSEWAARITGYVTTTFEYGFVGMGTNLSDPKEPVDLGPTGKGYTGITFYQKGDEKDYRLKMPSQHSDFADGDGDDHFGYVFTSTADWELMDVPFSSLTQEGWGSAVAWEDAVTMIDAVQFQTVGQPHDSIELWVDYIEFY